MNCKQCRATITALLESMDAPVAEIDLVTKRIVAAFGSGVTVNVDNLWELAEIIGTRAARSAAP